MNNEATHIEALGNGLGGQSMYCLWMACQKIIPATVSITFDTGWENDCLWNTGRRSTAKDYFDEVVVPLAESGGVIAKMVRAKSGDGEDKRPLGEVVEGYADGNSKSIFIPMFGSKGGQLPQTCTDNWKIKAIQQELRRMGAKMARCAQGIRVDEFLRRVRGLPLGTINGWKTYQTGLFTTKKTLVGGQVNIFGGGEIFTESKTRVFKPIKWMTHYYPLSEMKLNRQGIRDKLDALGIPYLLSSECDGCPHKNWERWERTSPETIDQLASMEAKFNGEFFLTNKRIPLKEALKELRKKSESDSIGFEDFGCENDVCGI